MGSGIVVAYSGGLDTSFCVPYLAERHGEPVITVTVNTGGLTEEEAQALQERALALGAARHLTVDARARLFAETLRYLLMGNVLRGQIYPLCVGAERGVQAAVVAETARAVGARAVAHGCTAAGNDQVRFDVALRTLAPELEILAPIRDEGLTREEEAAYLARRGFPVSAQRAAYSVNHGLWGCTIGGRETTDTVEPLPEEAWVLTRGAFDSPRPPERHTIGFEAGVPTAWDGQPQEAVALIEYLNRLAGSFGIGRGIHLGDTVLGVKGRVGFEAPAAVTLITAHRELEKLTLTGRQQRVKDAVAQVYGELVHEGLQGDPVGRDIEALLRSSQQRVTGEVRLLLRPGVVFVEGVRSPFSLRAASKAVYGERAAEWSGAEARGLAKFLGMQGLLYARAGGRA